MQLAVIISLFAAAIAVNAAPSSTNVERQESHTDYLRLFALKDCKGDWVEDITIVQNPGDDACHNSGISTFHLSINSTAPNTLTRTVRIYSVPDCDENSGSHGDIAPRYVGCNNLIIKSYKFL